jgi:hypothetical protein
VETDPQWRQRPLPRSPTFRILKKRDRDIFVLDVVDAAGPGGLRQAVAARAGPCHVSFIAHTGVGLTDDLRPELDRPAVC